MIYLLIFLLQSTEANENKEAPLSRTAILVITFISLILFVLGFMACLLYYTNWKKNREDPAPRYCPISQSKIIPTPVKKIILVEGVTMATMTIFQIKILLGDVEDMADALLLKKQLVEPTQCVGCNKCPNGQSTGQSTPGLNRLVDSLLSN